MLGGVAAGIARTYGIDVLLVRVLFVVAGVLWIGVPAYVIAWIAIAPDDGPPVFTPGRRDPKMILALGSSRWVRSSPATACYPTDSASALRLAPPADRRRSRDPAVAPPRRSGPDRQ